jgi:murein DD-endopeptidase MepM/ murein hydrolase activator NlpD
MKIFAAIPVGLVLLIAIGYASSSNLFIHEAKAIVPSAFSAPLSETGGPSIDLASVAIAPLSTDSVYFSGGEDVLKDCPVADGFAYPVGAPLAEGYRDVQPFGENHHLGEDWNGGRGKGGNGDLGDPIYTIANGVVTYAQPVGKKCRYGWGNVVKVVHNAGTRDNPKYVESLYAHLDEIHVRKNQILERGDQLGTMGTCNGVYWSHLHFELRSEPFLPIGRGYAIDKTGYLDPKKFIEQHRFDLEAPPCAL